MSRLEVALLLACFITVGVVVYLVLTWAPGSLCPVQSIFGC